jgi:hypothetical protein
VVVGATQDNAWQINTIKTSGNPVKVEGKRAGTDGEGIAGERESVGERTRFVYQPPIRRKSLKR